MRVKSIKKIKPRKVYAITTSTNTFIADGLSHHNCVYCNRHLSGNLAIYRQNLVRDFGIKWVEKLEQDANDYVIYTVPFMLEIEKDLKIKIKELKAKLNN